MTKYPTPEDPLPSDIECPQCGLKGKEYALTATHYYMCLECGHQFPMPKAQ